MGQGVRGKKEAQCMLQQAGQAAAHAPAPTTPLQKGQQRLHLQQAVLATVMGLAAPQAEACTVQRLLLVKGEGLVCTAEAAVRESVLQRGRARLPQEQEEQQRAWQAMPTADPAEAASWMMILTTVRRLAAAVSS